MSYNQRTQEVRARQSRATNGTAKVTIKLKIKVAKATFKLNTCSAKTQETKLKNPLIGAR